MFDTKFSVYDYDDDILNISNYTLVVSDTRVLVKLVSGEVMKYTVMVTFHKATLIEDISCEPYHNYA